MAGGGGGDGENKRREMRIAECVTAEGKQSLITLNYAPHKYPHISITAHCLSLLRHTAMDLDDLSKYSPHGHSSPRAVTDNTYQLGGIDDERERAQNAAIIEELERKKRLRKLAVPTDDKKVRERLRAYGEPITLFGEGVSSQSIGQRIQKTNTDEYGNSLETDETD